MVKKGFLMLGTLAILAGTCGVVEAEFFSCIAWETTDIAGYTYIRCDDSGNELWVAVSPTQVSVGDEVTFPFTAPLLNYYSRALHRTVPAMFFPPGLTRVKAAARKTLSEPAPVEQKQLPPPENDATYSRVDENGTVVFSDDPSKVKKKNLRKKKQ